MSTREGFGPIVQELEYLLAVRRQRAVEQIRLIIAHGYHEAARGCLPGETIEQVFLSVHSGVFPLRLSAPGLMIADVLVRKKPWVLTAARIERIIASDPFYLRLGGNVGFAQRTTKRPTRSSIKVYIQRIRRQIGDVLKEAGLATPPEKILISESTDLLNVTVYRFAVPCKIVHMDATERKS